MQKKLYRNLSKKTPTGEKLEEKEKSGLKSQILDILDVVSVSIVALIIVFTFAFKTCVVYQSSMYPTLVENDKLVIKSLGNNYDYGDIIVTGKYSEREDRIVKRIIAKEGDVVDINNSEGAVYINGEKLEEDYVNGKTFSNVNGIKFPITVSENSLFILGDNREHSKDSRSLDIGIINEKEVVGTVVFRLFPLEKIGLVK